LPIAGEVTPCRFSKALGTTQRNLLSYRSKGFELAGFEKITANSKAFGAKRLRTKANQTIPLKPNYNLVSQSL
jgi:hypothetical protein